MKTTMDYQRRRPDYRREGEYGQPSAGNFIRYRVWATIFVSAALRRNGMCGEADCFLAGTFNKFDEK